ncbi:MAG: class I adenylate cyclase, partial [Psychrosphaera sp.]|nr:class I adenylate cyclase [Psychrosphaera sp.]
CDTTDQQTPICNILKGLIHKGVDMETDFRVTDPYTLIFDSIFNSYRSKNPKFIELFKACLYIKSGCAFTRTQHVQGKNFKRDVVVDYLKSWNWDREKVQNYDQIEQWEFSQVNILGKQIHSFLIGCYRRISAKIQGKEQLVSDEDMTVIGRKISSFYGTKKGKIQYLKRAFETGLLQDELTITMELDLKFDTKQRWCAFRGRQHYQDTKNDNNPCFLKDNSDPVGLILWCIFNRIADFDSTFHLLQSHLPISVADIKELMEDAFMDCQPIRISELPAEQLLGTNQVSHCLLVVNFSSQASEQDVETVRVIYLTTWGELYSFGDIKAFKKNKTAFLAQTIRPHCRLFTPSRNNRKVLYQLIEEQTAFIFDKVGIDEEPVPALPQPDEDTGLRPENQKISTRRHGGTEVHGEKQN